MSWRTPTENEIALTPALPAEWAREFSMQSFFYFTFARLRHEER